MASYDLLPPVVNYDEDDTSSELSQLSSSQFTSFEFDSGTTPPTAGPSHEMIDDPNTALWHMRSTPRRSWIWQHGDSVKVVNKRYWQCRLCTNRNTPKKYIEGSTKHPIDHLKLIHRLTAQGPLDSGASSASIIRQAFGNSSLKIHFNVDVFKQLLVQWMVECHVSFRQVEEPSFRLLLSYLSAVSSSFISIPQCLPRSGNTIRSWTLQMFVNQKHILIQLLNNAHMVHFSFDMWTSGNNLALLGMVGHWINMEGISCRALLGLRRLSGAHTGENHGQIVFSILQEYSLTNKIGYFTLDNATNNDTTLAFVEKRLKDIGIDFDPLENRLRCLGHIINLVVKAFLYGSDAANLCGHDKKEMKELIDWRTKGPYR